MKARKGLLVELVRLYWKYYKKDNTPEVNKELLEEINVLAKVIAEENVSWNVSEAICDVIKACIFVHLKDEVLDIEYIGVICDMCETLGIEVE